MDKVTVKNCKNLKNKSLEEVFAFYNQLNEAKFHYKSTDDICTKMECVKKMVDYVPSSFWKRKKIKILDPCCGNGNFGAYLRFITSSNNIYYTDINNTRLSLCKKLLNPVHIKNENFFDINDKYDLVIGNPPYSGGGNKNRSLSNMFIEHSIDILNESGYLCFVVPNNWMTFNNNNTTLKMLLNNGSFIVIDFDVKKYFPKVGSSFCIFLWQKGVYTNKTTIYNNYLIKDVQKDIVIPKTTPFIPLYISQPVLNVIPKIVSKKRNSFFYRCDLHNFTQKDLLNDKQTKKFKYLTIHTARKNRYACIKQDIYDKWKIIVPLSTYYLPYIVHQCNVTQSIGYLAFKTETEAKKYLPKLNQPVFKAMVHLTRYGNFNNIMLLKYLKYDSKIKLTKKEEKEIIKINEYINY